MKQAKYSTATLLKAGACTVAVIGSALLLLQWRADQHQLQQVAAGLAMQERDLRESTQRQLAQLEFLQSTAHWRDVSPYAPAAWLSQIRRKAIDRSGISGFKASVIERQLRTELRAGETELLSVPIELEFLSPTSELALLMLQDIHKSLGQYVAVSQLSLQRQTRGSTVRGFRLRCRLLHYAAREAAPA